MRKLICLALSLVLLLSLVACQQSDPNETLGGPPMDNHEYTPVQGKLTEEKVFSFPIKTSDMTVEEMRQLCVDFFRYSKGALWIPNETVGVPINYAGTTLDEMTQGVVYGGLPYIGNGGCGNVYRMLDYYNEANATLDIRRAVGSFAGLFGNHCSGAAYWGWARVINSADYEYCAQMTHTRGFLRVGDYTYSDKISAFSSGHRTTQICEENGMDKMFECYAQMKPADGLVYYTTGGHVIMCASEPHVERLSDGTIDPNKSYMYILEQGQTWKKYTSAEGDQFQAKESIDKKVSFLYLFDHDYIPFTFAEFLGTDPVEETECTIDLSGDSVTKEQIFGATITSNYAISDAYVLIKNDKGVIQKYMIKAPTVHVMKLKLQESGPNIDVWGEPDLSRGGYAVEIIAQLGTGERLTLYSGTLTK